MYAIYGNIHHQYTPVMLAYVPAPWILWVWKLKKEEANLENTHQIQSESFRSQDCMQKNTDMLAHIAFLHTHITNRISINVMNGWWPQWLMLHDDIKYGHQPLIIGEYVH